MNDLESKAVELLAKFDDLATQYTPEVVDAALSVVQVNGISSILFGISLIIIVVFADVLRVKVFSKLNNQDKQVWSFFALVFMTISSIMAFFYLTSVWTWVAIFNPKLALAHQLLGL